MGTVDGQEWSKIRYWALKDKKANTGHYQERPAYVLDRVEARIRKAEDVAELAYQLVDWLQITEEGICKYPEEDKEQVAKALARLASKCREE